jgi:hypothetical protein
MWTCSGRIWLAKRPWNVVMVSKASEPQINADMRVPERSEGVRAARRGRQG